MERGPDGGQLPEYRPSDQWHVGSHARFTASATITRSSGDQVPSDVIMMLGGRAVGPFQAPKPRG